MGRDRLPAAPPSPVDEMSVIREVASDDGLVLWQCLRDVTLWAGASEGVRGRLFHAAAADRRRAAVAGCRLSEALRSPVRVLSAVVVHPTPLSPADVSGACGQIAAALEAEGCTASALAFAQAAALASPDDPAPALWLVVLSRRVGFLGGVEEWLLRAVALARRAERWDEYVAAYLELGRHFTADRRWRSAHKALRCALSCPVPTAVPPSTRQEINLELFRVARATGNQAAARSLAPKLLAYAGGDETLSQQVSSEVAAWREETDGARETGRRM